VVEVEKHPSFSKRSRNRTQSFFQTVKIVFMHFSALIQRTEKAVNQAKTDSYEIYRFVLTWMIMQDRLNLSEEIHTF